jgi:leucine dehydrogenase
MLQEAVQAKPVSVFEQIEKMGHEQVVFCYDAATGLKSIIGIHNTVCGPALGGTRMWSYANEADALNDVLRLSRGMTFKNALAGLNLGGGKAVIIGNARTDKNEAFLRRFGKFVNSLGGKYITAEDVGMGTADMDYINMETEHVTGIAESRGGSGDPSPFTALGVYVGMKAAAKKAFGNDSLEGKKVLVQGVGHVGGYLVDHLMKENAKVIICDIFEPNIKALTDKYPNIQVVPADDKIYDLDIDIYAPCALGATINDATISRLKCQVIAGAANNQLKDEKIHGNECLSRGIIYVPDFLINAGGVINVYSEIHKLPRSWSQEHTNKIYDTTTQLIATSFGENKNPQEVAIEMAMKRIDQIAKIRTVR